MLDLSALRQRDPKTKADAQPQPAAGCDFSSIRLRGAPHSNTMFKARRKDIRRRPMTKTEDESDDDGNISDASVGTAPTPAAATAPPPGGVAGGGAGAVGDEVRPKKMRKKAKAKVDKGPKPVLSFGHEDEEESGVADKVGKEAKGTDGVFRVKRSKASKVGRDWGVQGA